jgi:hypothetical protein
MAECQGGIERAERNAAIACANLIGNRQVLLAVCCELDKKPVSSISQMHLSSSMEQLRSVLDHGRHAPSRAQPKTQLLQGCIHLPSGVEPGLQVDVAIRLSLIEEVFEALDRRMARRISVDSDTLTGLAGSLSQQRAIARE